MPATSLPKRDAHSARWARCTEAMLRAPADEITAADGITVRPRTARRLGLDPARGTRYSDLPRAQRLLHAGVAGVIVCARVSLANHRPAYVGSVIPGAAPDPLVALWPRWAQGIETDIFSRWH